MKNVPTKKTPGSHGVTENCYQSHQAFKRMQILPQLRGKKIPQVHYRDSILKLKLEHCILKKQTLKKITGQTHFQVRFNIL